MHSKKNKPGMIFSTATNSRLILLSMTCLTLVACGSTKNASESGLAGPSRIDQALARAAEQSDSPAQSLIFLERAYKRNPDNVDATVSYAKALREAEYYNRAGIVLNALARDPDGPADAKAEYAATQLALGNYIAAERYAQQAVLQDDENHQAYHYLGIALDAQGLHKEAERSFRKALDHWQGDPTAIINNLALNLTSQEYLDEALELLEKALAVSPERTELERNYRIISALRETKVPRAPKPAVKPARTAMVKDPISEVAEIEEEAEITAVSVEKVDIEKADAGTETATEEKEASDDPKNLTLQDKKSGNN